MDNFLLVYLIGYVLSSIISFGEVFDYAPKFERDRLYLYVVGFIIFLANILWPILWIILAGTFIYILYRYLKIKKELDDNPILRDLLQDFEKNQKIQ